MQCFHHLYLYCNHYTLSEIPLFHVLNARITFGNINGCDSAVEGVTTIEEAGKVTACIEETSFDSPPGYRRLGKIAGL